MVCVYDMCLLKIISYWFKIMQEKSSINKSVHNTTYYHHPQCRLNNNVENDIFVLQYGSAGV